MKIELNTLPFFSLVIACIALDIFLVIVVAASLKFLPPVVPLLYGLAEGEEQLAEKGFLVAPAITSLIIIITNCLIALRIREEFLKRAIVLAAVSGTFLP